MNVARPEYWSEVWSQFRQTPLRIAITAVHAMLRGCPRPSSSRNLPTISPCVTHADVSQEPGYEPTAAVVAVEADLDHEDSEAWGHGCCSGWRRNEMKVLATSAGARAPGRNHTWL